MSQEEVRETLKIINQTHWRTADLKRILQRAAEQELEPEKRKRVIVTVSYSGRRHDASSGHAWIGGRSCTVRIPKGPKRPEKWYVDHYTKYDAEHGTEHLKSYLERFKPDESMRKIKLSFAKVACHEFAHLRGMQHKQMPSRYHWSGDWEKHVSWAADLPLEVKPVPKKKPVDLQEARYENVLRLEKHWLSRLKAAQKKVKLYTGKRHYYERALAAKRPN